MAAMHADAGAADVKEIRETVRVFCRQRPPVEQEAEDGLFITASSSEVAAGIVAATPDGQVKYREAALNVEKEFKLHGYFGPDASQQEVYAAAARPIVRSVLEGFNGTIFAYGQTSAGKTFTMLGDEDRPGIIPQAVQEMLRFCDGNRLQLSLSYLQIYCEMLTDLLADSQRLLSIREQNGRVYVEGLSRHPITSWEDCEALLNEGAANRVTASTRMNAQSSRSHAALLLHVTKKEGSSDKAAKPHALIHSTLFLVDLAGSERVDVAANANYVRMEELKAINLSLSALGNCISALSEGRLHVPYRDAKLTRLLQGSLGGNSRTAVVVAVKPGNDPHGETHNTLKFAQRVAKITVAARVTRTEDYEALYNAVLSQLDEKASLLVQAEIRQAKLEAEHETLRKALTESTERQMQLEAQLTAVQDAFQSSVRALKLDRQTHGAGEGEPDQTMDMSCAIEEIAQTWSAKLELVQAEHQRQITALREQHQRQLEALKKSLAATRQETSDAEYQLTSEREAHLMTVKEHKRCQDSLFAVEAEKAERTAELLAELDSKRHELERMEAALKESRLQAERAEQVASNLQDRVAQLEEWPASQQPNMDDYVHRDKVEEMELLFMDTIDTLSERVRLLEQDGESRDSRGRAIARTAKADASRQPSRIEPGRVRVTKPTSTYGSMRR